MRTKKDLSHVMLFALLAGMIVFAGTGSAYAQVVQKASLSPSSVTVSAVNDPVDVTVVYDCEDKTVNLFSAKIHYNSSVLTYVTSMILHTDASQPVQDRAEEAAEDDGDAKTDRVVVVSYNDIFTGADWPGDSSTLPLNLVTLSFVAKSVEATTINVTGSKASGVDSFQGTGASVGPATCDAVAAFTATTSDLTATFDTTGSTGTLSFDYGDSNTGTALTHTYAAAGTYNVKLTATGTGGCTKDVTKAVTVTAPTCDAVAAFTATTADLTATFDTTGSAGTLSFDYGDGNTGTALTHTYAAAGTYNVKLTATGTGGCTKDVTKAVTVTAPTCDAVAAFTATASGLTATFDTTGSNGTLSFDYGDGSTGAAMTHAYAAAGTYNVTLTATGTGGCTKNSTKTVTVSTTCVAVAKIAADKTSGVDPLAVTLNSAPGSTAGAGITYKWEITKGGSLVTSSTNASYQYSFNAGTYTVKLTVTNTPDGGCVGTDAITITVTPVSGCKAGDADLDGEVDIFDALKIAMYVAGLTNITDACVLDAIDVNEDGKVDINDALAIAKYDVGLDCGCVLNR